MLEAIKQIWFTLIDFFGWVYDFLVLLSSYIVSIAWFLFYSWKSLIVWVFKVFYNLIDWDVLVNVIASFYKLADYIGGPWALLLFCLFFIVIVRILIAFIFKILRLNLDYHVRTTKWNRKNREPTDYVEDETYPRLN